MFPVRYELRCYIYSLEATHPLVREDVNYIRTMATRVHLQKKKNSGRESQGAWRQDELIENKPPGVK
jgi:hypothetical protein